MYSRQIIKSVSRSLTKLSQTTRPAIRASPNRNARIKTLQRQTVVDSQAIEQELQQLGYSKQFLHTLFLLKCEDNHIKANEAKYSVFVTALLKKMRGSNNMVVADHNLKDKSLAYLLDHMNDITTITGVDLSGSKVGIESVLKLLNNHPRLIEAALRNNNMQSQEIKAIFDCITTKQQILSLDLSNRSSDNLNRFNENLILLEKFLQKNQTLMILELEGLNLRDKGIEAIERSYKLNPNPSLIYLNLKNNNISRHSYVPLRTILLKGSLKELNLSYNNLTDQGIEELGDLKNTQLAKLDLSHVGMQSKGLIAFLEKSKDSKDLETLILDHNDFSNNWFIRIREVIDDNRNLKELRMCECRIKYLQSLFEGLTDNLSLLRLNISRNSFDESYQELRQCIVVNQTLRQLRMKFCNINQEGMKKLAKALEVNKTLEVLDLTENPIGAEAGKELLASVYLNSTLITLLLEKTQIELSTRKFIEERIGMNQAEHSKRSFQLLLRENNTIKQKDRERTENLETLNSAVEDSKNTIRDLKSLIEVLTAKFATAKKRHQQTLTFCEGQMANLNKELMRLQVDNRPLLNNGEYALTQLNSKIEEAKHQRDVETRKIKKLETFLVSERVRVRKMEDTLEQQYENEKYLRKKQSVSLPKLAKEDSSPAKRSRVVQIRTASKVELKTK